MIRKLHRQDRQAVLRLIKQTIWETIRLIVDGDSTLQYR